MHDQSFGLGHQIIPSIIYIIIGRFLLIHELQQHACHKYTVVAMLTTSIEIIPPKHLSRIVDSFHRARHIHLENEPG